MPGKIAGSDARTLLGRSGMPEPSSCRIWASSQFRKGLPSRWSAFIWGTPGWDVVKRRDSMFIDKSDVSEKDFIFLLFLLNLTQQGFSCDGESAIEEMTKVMPRRDALLLIDDLRMNGLIYLSDEQGEDLFDYREGAFIGLSRHGLAFMINYANEYLERISARYGEVPEKLVASLIPYLELAAVPAADRYVNTKDNFPEFEQLAKDLETIRLELIKDENKNELPIPEKKQVLSDIDAMLAQIHDGVVRLSDLTSRIRPIVKNLAEWCKDIAIIAAAASGAYLAIEHILQKLFEARVFRNSKDVQNG
jgi:hypothetical protein